MCPYWCFIDVFCVSTQTGFYHFRKLFRGLNQLYTASKIRWLSKILTMYCLFSLKCFLSFSNLTATAWSEWYPPPGFDTSNQTSRAATLKNAVVTCTKPPSPAVSCTKEAGPCLFDVENDPCEYVNQAKNNPNVLNQMLQWLEEFKQTMVHPRNKPMDPKANPNNFGGVWSPWMD